MTWITKIALKKRWLTMLIAALVAGASIWAMLSLQMELFPDIELPMTTVITVYPQAQAEEVMETVTIPIEKAIDGIEGLEHITSTSAEGSSVVFVQFAYGTNMDKVNDIIAERLDTLELPQQVRGLPAMMPGLDENPRLFPIDINMMPVVTLSFIGDASPKELQQIADTQLVPELKAIVGVFNVSVEGGAGEKILVSPSVEQMTRSGISMGQLVSALAMQSYESVADVENAFLSPDGPQLKHLAGVSFGPGPGEGINRTNGKPSISISLTKEASANTVTTANAIIDKAAELEANLPSGMELVTIMDQSEYIEGSISDLKNSALVGGGLAIVVVFLFLMAVRASLVTAISIPLSILIGFLVMRFTGITINILTLSAMVIAVGRVIDNSIVILEVIYRHMQLGERFKDAAINGTKEVVVPITSATIATVVIFLPLALVGGIVGEMFIPFALTIAFALIGSLLIALTVVPALSGWLTVKKTGDSVRKPRYLRIYTSVLRWCLGHRVATLVISIFLFLGSLALIPLIGTSFIPEMNSNVLTIQIEMPEDSSYSTVNGATIEAESLLAADPDVLTYSTTIGSGSGTTAMVSSIFGGGNGSNIIGIETVVTPNADIDKVATRLSDRLDEIIEQGIVSTASQQAAMSGQMSSGLEITIRGDTNEDVVLAGEQLLTRLESASQGDGVTSTGNMLADRRRAALANSLKSLANLEIQTSNVQSSLVVEPDLSKMTTLGLSPDQMGLLQQEFMLMARGTTVAAANIDGSNYEIYLKGIMEDITTEEIAKSLMVGAPIPVPLDSIATVEMGERLTNIRRYDQKISATITGTVGQENIGAVNMAVQSEIDSMDFPSGIQTSMGGISEDMQESFSAMFMAIGIAIGLVYLVLVLTFRSLRNPLIIMVSLPLASIGALLGLLVTGNTLGVTGLMGVLMLVGIVLTNAVVLVTVVEQLRKTGLNDIEAIVQGGETRLRPILMTAITTMIAMLPLAFGAGEGVLMAAELATVVIGGLFSSTLLTLLVIPVIYAMTHRVRHSDSVTVPTSDSQQANP